MLNFDSFTNIKGIAKVNNNNSQLLNTSKAKTKQIDKRQQSEIKQSINQKNNENILQKPQPQNEISTFAEQLTPTVTNVTQSKTLKDQFKDNLFLCLSDTKEHQNILKSFYEKQNDNLSFNNIILQDFILIMMNNQEPCQSHLLQSFSLLHLNQAVSLNDQFVEDNQIICNHFNIQHIFQIKSKILSKIKIFDDNYSNFLYIILQNESYYNEPYFEDIIQNLIKSPILTKLVIQLENQQLFVKQFILHLCLNKQQLLKQNMGISLLFAKFLKILDYEHVNYVMQQLIKTDSPVICDFTFCYLLNYDYYQEKQNQIIDMKYLQVSNNLKNNQDMSYTLSNAILIANSIIYCDSQEQLKHCLISIAYLLEGIKLTPNLLDTRQFKYIIKIYTELRKLYQYQLNIIPPEAE